MNVVSEYYALKKEQVKTKSCLILHVAIALICLFFTLLKSNFIRTSTESQLLQRKMPEGQK